MRNMSRQPVPVRTAACRIALVLAAAGWPAAAAHAQAMDYAMLEQVFGEPVTTAATGTPQRASEAPANMTIITADDIRRAGSRNIPEILGQVAGLDILRSSATAYDVGVRGYQQPTQPRMLVLIDGRQVFLDDYSRTDWSNLPVNIDDIRQIEVVKGAASALFGSNAASGVINIVTRNPQYEGGIAANLTVGTQQHRSLDGTIRLKGARGGLKLSFGGMDSREFPSPYLPADGYVTPASPDGRERPTHRYVALGGSLALADNLQASAEGSWTRSVSNMADNTDFNVMSVQHDESYSLRGGLSWDSRLGTLSAQAYLNHTFVTLLETNTGVLGFGTRMNLVAFQVQDQFRLGTSHTLRIGAESRFRDYRQSNDQFIVQDPHLVQHILSVNGTWLWRTGDRLTLSSALRLDHQTMRQAGQINPSNLFTYADYRHTNDAVSANLTANFSPTERDHFRLSYGRGVMLPSLIQNGYTQILDEGAPFLIDAEGNPRLKPTIVEDLSLDYSRAIEQLASTLKVSLFVEWNRNVIAPFVAGPLIVIAGQPALANFAQNIGSSHGWGGEVELQGKLASGLRWDLSYSHMQITDDAQVRSELDYEDAAPRHHWRAALGYSQGRWEIDAFGQAMSSTAMVRDLLNASGPTPTDGYATLSGRIGYSLAPRVTLALSGTNLTRRITRTSAFPAIERQAFLGLTARY